RTTFAMAAARDLPSVLAAVDPVRKVPHRAEFAAAILTVGAVLSGDLTQTLAASAFSVLVYYAVANIAALRLSAAERRWPRALAVIGLVACIGLALSLPGRTMLIGTAVLVGALLIRAVIVRLRH